MLRRASAWWRHFRSVPEEFPNVRIEGLTKEGVLLWDGDCGFCAATLRILKRFVRKPFSERAYQSVRDLLPAEVSILVDRQAHWIDSDGRVSGGSAAIVNLLENSGRPLLASFLDSALCRPVLWIGYRLVASKRGLLTKVISHKRAIPH